jgi:chemotaxis protein CheD
MYVRNSARFQKDMKIIYPGEYYISGEDELIGTLLGSCVSVCLVDRQRGRAGMNHFMLPGRISKHDIFKDRSARYGITAINKLIVEMEKLGSPRKDLAAKVFGGGSILVVQKDANTIPFDNIRVAKILLEIEDIPIVKTDVGGEYTRKLLMEVKTGKVFLKKTTREDVLAKVSEQEKEYAMRSFGG